MTHQIEKEEETIHQRRRDGKLEKEREREGETDAEDRETGRKKTLKKIDESPGTSLAD